MTLSQPVNPIKRAKSKSKKKEATIFDKLEEARDKDIKKVLSRKEYNEFAKKRSGIRMKVRQQVLTAKAELDKEIARQMALEKQKADSLAAAEVAALALAAEVEAKKLEERAARMAAKKKAALKKKKGKKSVGIKKKKKKSKKSKRSKSMASEI
ncbi:MAG: hypothetical protein ACRCSB_00595 [Bacteroidales bacterium]